MSLATFGAPDIFQWTIPGHLWLIISFGFHIFIQMTRRKSWDKSLWIKAVGASRWKEVS